MKKLFLSSILILSTFVFSQHVTYYSSNPTENLFKAITSGNTKGVFDAVAKGANVNATCKISPNKNECFWKNRKNECSEEEDASSEAEQIDEYFTPLYIAAMTKQPQIVQFLLDNGANAKLPSQKCSLTWEGAYVPFRNERTAYDDIFYTDLTADDNSLRTAMVFVKNGLYTQIDNLHFLIENKNVSDSVLAEFIELMSQRHALERSDNFVNVVLTKDKSLLNEVTIIEDKVVSLLDQAYSENRPLTVKVLKSLGAKRVSYFEADGNCGEHEGLCEGPVYKVRFDDGSEDYASDCACGT